MKATYFFEGDGPSALHAHEHVTLLFSALLTHHYPNVVFQRLFLMETVLMNSSCWHMVSHVSW